MWLILTCLFSFSCVSFLTNETPEACKRKEQDPSKDRSNTPKKSRLVFTDLQRRTLLAIFKENKRPSKEMQLTISQQLGLELNTVSNFFMNARRRSLDKWLDEGSPGNTSSTSSTCTKAWSRGEGGWDGMGWERGIGMRVPCTGKGANFLRGENRSEGQQGERNCLPAQCLLLETQIQRAKRQEIKYCFLFSGSKQESFIRNEKLKQIKSIVNFPFGFELKRRQRVCISHLHSL